MADEILNPFNPDVQSNAVDLSDLVSTTPLQENTAPLPAVRNRAATTALLNGGDGQQATDSYNAMMQEGQSGGDQIYSRLNGQNTSATKDQDMSTIYTMLSDQTVPEAQKQAIIQNFSKSAFLKDSSASLQTKMAAAPNPGESDDSSNARISVANELSKMYNAREQVQGIVNKQVASMPDRTILGAVTDAAGQFLPFTSNILTSQIQKAVHPETSLLDQFRTFFTPGTTQKNLTDELNNLPPDQKVAFAQKLTDAIKQHSAIFGSDNQANAYDYMNNLTQHDYSRLDEFGTNAFAALDIIGLGGTARAIASGASKVGAALEGASRAAKIEPNVGFGTATGGPNEPSFSPSGGTRATAGRGPAPDISDVPFTESFNGNFQVVEPKIGPNGQLANPVPKLTAPVDRINQPTAVPPLLTTDGKVSTELAVSRVNPATPGELAQHVNPSQARMMHDAATASDDDNVANAFYGVSRDQEQLNAVAPQAAMPDTPVTTRVADIDQQARYNMRVDDDVMHVLYNQGGDQFTNAERAEINGNIVNDFENATGLRMVEGMGGEAVSLDGNAAHISAVYESPTGSWSQPETALEQTKYALRGYGIQDNEVQLLKKNGLVHEPVDLKDVAGQEGDYKVRVNTTHEITSADLRPHQWDSFDVKRNWGDRFGQTMSQDRGSLNSYLIDSASQLHPTITGSTVNADYQATKLDKILLQKLKPVGDLMSSLKSPEKMALEDYFREANFKGIDFDETDLAARGFSNDAISAARQWRDYWDTHYFLENKDYANRLAARGHQVFDNGVDKFFAKPIPKNSGIQQFYDPATQVIRGFNQGELDALYNGPGRIAEFVRPIEINGQTVQHMIVRNTPQEYLRGIRDTDQILNKKKGYFQITYKSPKFVDKIQLNSAGQVINRKTVAVAGDTPTAEAFRKRMSQTSFQDQYEVRGDIRAQDTGLDTHWDLDSSAGRIAQRYRGKLLEDASSPNQLGSNSYVDNPINSAIRAANSISNRTINGPVLEATKERFVQQYGHLIEPNVNHVVAFPTDIGQIGRVGHFTTAELADARTSYNKIRSLEHGYINTLDQTSKAFFNYIGDQLGNSGYAGGERLARAVGERSPQFIAKKLASDLYIALNPLKQIVIQPWQAVRLVGYNPLGAKNYTQLAYEFYAHKINPSKYSSPFVKFAEESGLLDSVDRHTLVNGSLVDLANTNSGWARIPKMLYTPVDIARKVGFDAGEYANRVMHLAAVYDRFERLGMDLTKRTVRANAASEASALMGDMTRAGEMPINNASLGAAYQFMAAPHKMLLQPFNRRLPLDVRMRMLGTDAMLFGVAPVAAITGWLGIDHLTNNNQTLSDAISYGLVGMVLNGFIQQMEPGTAKVDTSGLDPRGYDGLLKMAQNFMGGGIGAAIIGSPAGQLLTGNRLHDAFQNTGRFFKGLSNPDDNNPITFLSMISSWGELASGWSNIMKAKMMMQTQQRADSYGKLIDNRTGTYDAIAQAFGFGSKSQQEIFSLSQELSSNKKGFEQEVQKQIQDIMRYYQRELGTNNTDPRFVSGVTGWALDTYKNDPKAQEIVAKQLKQAFQTSGDALTRQIMDACDMPNPGNIHDIITRAPNISDENKQALHHICNQFHDAINQQTQEK